MVIFSSKFIFCPYSDIFDRRFKEGEFGDFPLNIISITAAIFKSKQPEFLLIWHVLLLPLMVTSTQEQP